VRRLLFHVRRTVRDLRRGGIRVLVRKVRRIPDALRSSSPWRLVTGTRDAFVLLVLAVRFRGGARGRDWILERLRVMRQSASASARRDPIDGAVRGIRGAISVGRISEAATIVESLPSGVLDDPRVLHERAQVAYLRGDWESVTALKKAEVEVRDRRAADSWVGSLNVRFLSGAFTGHIGHLGLIDLVVKARELGLLSPEPRQVVARRESVANVPYLECWRPHVEIAYVDVEQYRNFEETMRPLFDDISVVRLRSGLTDLYTAYSSVNERWRLENRGPLLVADPDVTARGRATLARHGLDPEGWFVGLHVREGDPHWWTNAVDADPLSYVPMIEAIVAAGGTVVRMGNPTMTPLPDIRGCIDYAHLSERSPELDVVLWSQCRFFVGTPSGPLAVPPTFGRPSLLTNMPPIGLDQWFERHVVLPKRIVRATGRAIPYDELLRGPFGWSISRRHEGLDGSVVDNTPDELVDAAEEMLRLTVSASFPGPTAAQTAVSASLRALGRTGSSPVAQSFIDRHPDLFPSATG
jgi:putative glycosyltransferase (TIGR04372 family)